LVEKPEGKRLLGRPGRRRKNVIRIDLREITWRGGVVDWIRLAQNRDRWLAVVNVVMNLRVLATRSYLENVLISYLTNSHSFKMLQISFLLVSVPCPLLTPRYVSLPSRYSLSSFSQSEECFHLSTARSGSQGLAKHQQSYHLETIKLSCY
jgi:hypothetical protein